MSYTVINFRTKKALKEAVQTWVSGMVKLSEEAKPVRCYNTGLGPDLSNYTGVVYLEGPHYPEPHRWYAQAELKDGIVVKVS